MALRIRIYIDMLVYAENDNGIFIAIKNIPSKSQPPEISRTHAQ